MPDMGMQIKRFTKKNRCTINSIQGIRKGIEISTNRWQIQFKKIIS